MLWIVDTPCNLGTLQHNLLRDHMLHRLISWSYDCVLFVLIKLWL